MSSRRPSGPQRPVPALAARHRQALMGRPDVELSLSSRASAPCPASWRHVARQCPMLLPAERPAPSAASPAGRGVDDRPDGRARAGILEPSRPARAPACGAVSLLSRGSARDAGGPASGRWRRGAGQGPARPARHARGHAGSRSRMGCQARRAGAWASPRRAGRRRARTCPAEPAVQRAAACRLVDPGPGLDRSEHGDDCARGWSTRPGPSA